MEQGTIPRLFAAKVRRYGSAKVALRQKAYGIWQQITWQQYYENVSALCLGLVHLRQPTHVALSRAGGAVGGRNSRRNLHR
jgi:long-subunit acyl-CoA synthetase (AMP-forming)